MKGDLKIKHITRGHEEGTRRRPQNRLVILGGNKKGTSKWASHKDQDLYLDSPESRQRFCQENNSFCLIY